MKNQIIKLYVDVFDQFVKDNLVKENNYYIFNHLIFKKINYDDTLKTFMISLKPFYFKNKHYYLERDPITFNQFNTILRQVCKRNNIKYDTNIKYNSSKYSIEYFIYLDDV